MDAYVPPLISIVLGYLLGSIPFGVILTDGAVRKVGSGNIGATNVLRTGNRLAALATLLLDGAKAGLALAIARHFFGDVAGFCAGAAALIGHCFPVWLKFKGGKGVATFFGLMLVGMPLVGIGAALIWLIVAFVFRYSSLAALWATASAPLFALAFHFGWPGFSYALVVAALIWQRHGANIGALRRGEERRINLSKRAA